MHAFPSSPRAADAGGNARAPRRLVIDAPMRMFHWLFALSFAGAYLTADSESWRMLHVTLGYVFAGLLGARLLYGLFGPAMSRLGMLRRKLAAIPGWLRGLGSVGRLSAADARQGVNLAIGFATALMLALVIPLAFSGYATYSEWGDWLEDVHEFFANAFLFVVFAHLALIALSSALRRQNLAGAMLTGRVPGVGPSPVQRNRSWLAALLLLAVLAFGAWQSWRSPQGLLGWSDGGIAFDAPAAHHHSRKKDDD